MSKFLVTKKHYGDSNAKFIVGKQVLEIDDINKQRFSTIKKHFKTFIDIVFDSCGGNNIESITLALGDTFKDLPIPTKSQHIFLGWFTSASGGTQITSDSLVSLDINILYAQWEEIKIDPNNCTSYSVTTTSSYKNTGIYTASISNSSQPIYIDWGDGTVEKMTSSISQKSHTYQTVGNFTVKISDNITSFAPSYSNSTWYGTTSHNRYTFKGMLTTGSKVTSLPAYAFYYCQAMTNIDFMQTCWSIVTTIPNYCFYYCTGLTSIQGAKRFTGLGSYCFQYCSGLTGIQDLSEFKFTMLPNSYTFANCTNVTQWILPSGFIGTSFGSYMFSNNSKLTGIGNAEKTTQQLKAVQIEYLESTGTQYIDTKWIPTSTAKLTLGVNIQDYTTSTRVIQMGCIQSGGKPYYNWSWAGYFGSLVSHWYFGNYTDSMYRTKISPTYNIGDRMDTILTYDGSGIASANGEEFSCPSANAVPQCSFYLFVRNNNNQPDYQLTGRARCLKFKIEDNGEIIQDLIPVRIGNVGYMYDKVSGKLFENQGTGNFILGPDKENTEEIIVEQETITSKLPNSLTSTGTYTFQNCSNLKNITIPSKVQSIGNYTFYGCTQLNNVNIEATSLTAINQYAFYNCNKLTDLDLPDTVKTIGNYAFYGCTSLNYAGRKVEIEIPDEPVVPDVPDTPEVDYLCFTAEQANSTVKMTTTGSAPTVYLETSTTGEEGTWSDFTVGSTTITLANVGDKVYFRAKQDNERFAIDYNVYNYFVMTGKIAASGNLNTLLKADGSVLDLTGRDYCYYCMFYGCTSLTQAPALPATTLANYCYNYMFQNCTSLTRAPELPATTLTYECYSGMFSYCASLIQAPSILPAMTLVAGCYTNMFSYCTSLTKAPALLATTLTYSCYQYMFNECASPFDLSSKTIAEVQIFSNQHYIFGMGYRQIQVICSDGTTTITLSYDSGGGGGM